MNKITVSLVSLVAVVGLVFGVLAYNKTPEVVKGPQGERGLQGPKGDKGDKGDRGPAGSGVFGAVSGNDFSNQVTFLGGAKSSNAISTTSQGASITVTGGEFTKWVDASTVAFSQGLTSAVTLTLPASSTIPSVVPRAGDTQRFCIRNATTTASLSVTLAGGTGLNLLVASSTATALGSKTLLTGKVGCMTLVRQPATATTFDIDALLTVFN